MIKLFWNTQNQKQTISNDINIKKKEATAYKWGIYHRKNSDSWIYEILKKTQFNIIDSEKDLESGDILVIIDSNPENKIDLYEKFKLLCSKILLFHLGDETGPYDLSQIYNNCNYVFRPFCSNKYFKNKKVKCIPIGYKSGIKEIKKNFVIKLISLMKKLFQ